MEGIAIVQNIVCELAGRISDSPSDHVIWPFSLLKKNKKQIWLKHFGFCSGNMYFCFLVIFFKLITMMICTCGIAGSQQPYVGCG